MLGPEFVTVSEAAERFGVSPQTVRNWTKAGHLKSYRHPANNYRLFKKADIDVFARSADVVADKNQQELDFRDSDNSLRSKLSAIDWSFAGSSRADGLHSIHPYPAKFIPEIPRALLDIFAPPRDTAVFDPFCGSGVTLAEAAARGLKPVGVDLNPIACLISRVKLQAFPNRFPEIVNQVAHAAVKSERSAPVPSIPALDHWFDPQAQRAVASLRREISKESSDAQDPLLLTLSSILVRVSRQESDTRYAAIEKNITAQGVIDAFTAAGRRLSLIMNQRDPLIALQSPVILNKSITNVSPGELPANVGLVITSPPYPNAYEYWLYHKYRMYWLGHDPKAVKAQEIGARAHYFSSKPPTVLDFYQQMRSVLDLCKQVCISGAHICFVIGRSKIHGKIIDNASVIRDAAADVGLVHFDTLSRTLMAKRKSFNLSHANIKTENIVILRKP